MCDDKAPEWVVWLVAAPLLTVLWAMCAIALKGAWLVFSGKVK